MIKVLIVHDRSILSQGLRMLLSSEPDFDVVGEATDEGQAVAMATELDAQVALVDGDMKLARGLAAARALSAACPQIHIVLLSLHDDPETRASAEQAGISDFVSKQMPPQVLAAIRKAGRYT